MRQKKGAEDGAWTYAEVKLKDDAKWLNAGEYLGLFVFSLVYSL